VILGAVGRPGKLELALQELLIWVELGVAAENQSTSVGGWESEHRVWIAANLSRTKRGVRPGAREV
jgi:hypothetical protein